jgi:hypothetical protein
MRQQLCHIRTSDATVKRDRGKKETGKRKNETCRQCHDKLARCGSAPALLLHAPSPPAPATALAHTPVCVCVRARACLPVCLYACGVRMRAHVCVCARRQVRASGICSFSCTPYSSTPSYFSFLTRWLPLSLPPALCRSNRSKHLSTSAATRNFLAPRFSIEVMLQRCGLRQLF